MPAARSAASFQDPSVIWNIARNNSSFKIKRYGVVRSQDKLNVTGTYRRDDGIFAPASVSPVSFARSTVTVKDKKRPVVIRYSRNANNRLRKDVVASTNGKAQAKGVRKLKKIGRLGFAAAIRASRAARAVGRSYKKNRDAKSE